MSTVLESLRVSVFDLHEKYMNASVSSEKEEIMSDLRTKLAVLCDGAQEGPNFSRRLRKSRAQGSTI